DDALDGAAGAGHVGDRHELGPYMGSSALVEVGTDERPLLPYPFCQMHDAVFDGPVQIALGGEVLPARLQLARLHGRRRGAARHEAFAVGHVHAFGSFEIHEVLHGRVAEWEQPQLDTRRIALGLMGHVRPADVWRRSHGGQQVLDEGPVQHLLGRDGEDDRPPSLDGLELFSRQSRPPLGPEAEGGEEVLRHEAVLELGRLRQQIRELLAVLDNDPVLVSHRGECRRLRLRFSIENKDRGAATFRVMAVPLPSDAEVNLQPPEPDEVGIIARGVMGAVAPPGGLTDLQKVLIKAIVHSMTGVIVEPDELEPIGPEAVAEGLRRRDIQFRTRIVQVMALAELVLVPLPDEVARRVERYAAALNVSESMLEVADRYAAGAMGLALVDFNRNGYTADWNPEHVQYLHATADVAAPWDVATHDETLAARWTSLADCASGSLGQGVYHFYRARGFTFPGLPGSAPPLLAQHDWVHVLADYGTTVESEIEVFGLIARANDDPHGFSLLAMVIGLFETGYIPAAAGLFEYDPGHLSKAGMACR